MPFKLSFSNTAADTLVHLKERNAPKYKKVAKALGYLEVNPRHQSLNTHEFSSLEGLNKEKVFEAYAENDTPGAYRIFFYYPKGKQGEIYIIAITPHPD